MPWKLMPPLTPSGLTPGVSRANCSQRRELTGRLLTSASLTFCDCSVFSVSRRGISVVTVTNVCWADTGISISTLAVAPTCRATAARFTVENPVWLTVMS